VQDALNEHYLRPGVDHADRDWFNRDGDRLIWTFNRTVAMGVLPVSRVTTGHTFAVQQLYKVRVSFRQNPLLNPDPYPA
jgi:hypothetical protein